MPHPNPKNTVPTPAPITNPTTRVILQPKSNGLVKGKKPTILVVHSPYDEAGGAVDHRAAFTYVDEIGYGVINKTKLTWDTSDEASLTTAIKPVKMNGKPLTIWLEAHGAPGWFFGGERSARSEFQNTFAFISFIRAIEAQTGGVVRNVLLSGCFTANELFNEEANTFFCSPARMLSMFLPDANVIGFIGQNGSAKVTNVFEKTATGGYASVVVTPHEAAVLYTNGKVKETYTRELYCNHKYTPIFIRTSCKLGIEDVEDREAVFYKPCNVLEMIAGSSMLKALMIGKSYGEQQVASAKIVIAREAAAAAAAVVEEVADEDEAPVAVVNPA